MNQLSYRTALLLSMVFALTTLATWGLVAYQIPALVTYSIKVIVSALILPFGLWVGSSFVRYLGGALLVLWAGGLIWPLISPGIDSKRLFLQMLFLLAACLSLCIAWLLLFSSKFSTEFAEEQKSQPRYKALLRRGLLGSAIAAMVLATANDVYQLAQQ